MKQISRAEHTKSHAKVIISYHTMQKKNSIKISADGGTFDTSIGGKNKYPLYNTRLFNLTRVALARADLTLKLGT